MERLNKLVVATFNLHKVQEISAWFRPQGVEIIALANYTREMPAETGATFAENAYIKAQNGFKVSGLPTLADDSGLEVDALSGGPGIHSARFAGEGATDAANNSKLVAALKGVTRRSARFRCAISLVREGDLIQAEGICPGIILETSRGSGGFGYDPLFWLPNLNLTMAELSQEKKNQISHRGRALANLMAELRSRGLI